MDHYCVFNVLKNCVSRTEIKCRFIAEFDDYGEAEDYMDALNHFCPLDSYYILRKLDDSEFADRFNYNPYFNSVWISQR